MIIEVISIILLVAFDQFTKYLTVTKLVPLNQSVQIVNGVFELAYVENTGAAFGIFKDGTLFLIIVVCIVILLIVYFKIRLPRTKHYRMLHALTTIIIAGAIGNLIDRIRLHYVIDMFHFYWFEFPVFNVADTYVTCSAILLMILIITKYKDLDF